MNLQGTRAKILASFTVVCFLCLVTLQLSYTNSSSITFSVNLGANGISPDTSFASEVIHPALPTPAPTAAPTGTSTGTPDSPLGPTLSPFPDHNELRGLVDKAFKDLKVFVYTIPEEILYYKVSPQEMPSCEPNLVQQGRNHFQHEHLIPTFFRNSNATLTTNWEEADFLLVPHFMICIWLGLGKQRPFAEENVECCSDGFTSSRDTGETTVTTTSWRT